MKRFEINISAKAAISLILDTFVPLVIYVAVAGKN
jgi:hypothetical protein